MKTRNLLLASAALVCLSSGLASGALAQSATFFAVLNGGNECTAASPPVCNQGDPDGLGSAVVQIIGPNNLCAAIVVDNLAGANQAHIHRAPASFFGPNVVELAAPHNPGAGDPGASTYCNNAVPAATIRDIIRNPRNYSINIHNVPYDNGAIRGQLF